MLERDVEANLRRPHPVGLGGKACQSASPGNCAVCRIGLVMPAQDGPAVFVELKAEPGTAPRRSGPPDRKAETAWAAGREGTSYGEETGGRVPGGDERTMQFQAA